MGEGGEGRCGKNPTGARGFSLLDAAGSARFVLAMLRQVLTSKIHRAMISEASVEYEGSIEIPADLVEEARLWSGEKVLVASITTGARLETYVQVGEGGTGKIIINGGAAHLIGKGERVTIMAFGLSEEPVEGRKLLLDENNNVLRATG